MVRGVVVDETVQQYADQRMLKREKAEVRSAYIAYLPLSFSVIMRATKVSCIVCLRWEWS